MGKAGPLRRSAELVLAQMRGQRRWSPALRRGWRWLRRKAQSRWCLPLIPALVVAPIFLPLSYAAPQLDEDSAARSFLQALWQVEATVIALSVAVIIFAAETFGASRGIGGFSLREFVRETRLLFVFWLGLGGLAAIGLTLAGLGEGAPSGWAATWSAVLGTVTAAAIAYLLDRTLTVSDVDRQLEIQLAQTKRLIAADTERRILERVALVHLDVWCRAHAAELNVVLARGPGANETAIPAPVAGTVFDVRLRRLARILARQPEATPDSPARLQVRLGSPVAVGNPLLVVPALLKSGRIRRYRRCFKVSE